jgi:hypothetical protein
MSSNVVELLRDEHDVEAERKERLRQFGIFLPPTLREARNTQTSRSYLVEGLLRTGSINLLVGDSGLGKTPLAIQLGVCITAGIPLFGRLKVREGRVLYCDAESDLSAFYEILESISRYLGLSAPPLDFHVWSPNWDADSTGPWDEELQHRVSIVKPALVIVDPLRMFWPNAEGKNAEAAASILSLREQSRGTGTSWLISHHRRKVNQQSTPVHLEESPHAWFQETAGSHALVNQSDTRLGVVPGTGQADLLLAGFVRGTGAIPPLNLARMTDDDGFPIGYRLLEGVEQLRMEDRTVFDSLGSTFRFKDVETALGGKSSSNAKRFLDRCDSLRIVRKQGKIYVKAEPS